MKVHRYIYTRLTKDLSPTGKNGFQSAFVPGDLIARKDVLEIESHIHFPEGLQIEGQSVVFYKQVKTELYMILLLLRPLPDVKDDFGRSGAFLCEGFILAEKDWRPIWRISDLIELVTPYRFASLGQLLASTDVDRTTGFISDLTVTVPPGYWTDALTSSDDEPQEELLLAMYHVAKLQDKDLAIVVEGLPAAVTHRLETCAMFMPEALRAHTGWDDAFDGGKIFFSPLRIFGYSELLPTTGRPVVFPADGSAPKWLEDGMQRFGKPSDPFSNWLLEVCVNTVPRARLDAMYALSQAMISGRPTAIDMESESIFEIVNKDAIRKLFIQGLLVHMELPWAEKLADLTMANHQLTTWMQGYLIADLTHLLEVSIVSQNLRPEGMKDAPPTNLVRQGSAALQTLATMWTLEIITPEILDDIPEDQIPEVLTLMLGRGSHQDTPFATIVNHFRDYLHKLARDPKIAENLRCYVAAKVPEEYVDFKEGMAAVAVQLGDYASLRGEPTDWLRLLDRWLISTGGNSEVWKAAKTLAKTTDLGRYVNLKAFALGEAAIPHELEGNGDGRKGFLRCLIEVHGFNEQKLIDMDFFSTEVRDSGSSTGFIGKLKRLFGR